MRAIFIRHGQSTGNAGVPCDDLGAIELTELGQEQAREVAASWTQAPALIVTRSEEHTSELQSLMRISYAVFCLKKKNKTNHHPKSVKYINQKYTATSKSI